MLQKSAQVIDKYQSYDHFFNPGGGGGGGVGTRLIWWTGVCRWNG